MTDLQLLRGTGALVQQSIPGVFNKKIKKFKEFWPQGEPLEIVPAILSEEKISNFNIQHHQDIFRLQLEKFFSIGILWVTIWDKEYPSSLLEIADPPAILFYRGNLPETGRNTICVVGTRKMSPISKTRIEKILKQWHSCSLQVVSGLARGVDTQVHTESCRNRISNFAVLGSGLNRIYPPENRQLVDSILESGGGIISEFLPDTEPDRFRFPQRNRIMSGLSSHIILVEAGEKSGALGTCQWALEHNREIWALPPEFMNDSFIGNSNWINLGAKILHSPTDICSDQSQQPDLFSNQKMGIIAKLNEQESLLLQEISKGTSTGIHRDDLLQTTAMNLGTLELVIMSLKQKSLIEENKANLLYRL